MPHQVALGVELEHRRRARAAVGRLQLEPLLVVGQRVGAAMDDPHVVLIVDPYPDGVAEHPMIGHRPRPHRIDLEARRLHTAAALRLNRPLERPLPEAQDDEQEEEYRAGELLSWTHDRSLSLRPPGRGRVAEVAERMIIPPACST